MKRVATGIYRDNSRLFTKNLVPGARVYNERLITEGNIEYRSWNPYRSKLAAAFLRGLRAFPVRRESYVLYLGVASGTTASHLSDIAIDGIIFGVDVAFKPMKLFVSLCRQRRNMIPILADANKPACFSPIVTHADILYQDIAQRNQVDIFLKNMDYFSVENGIIMVKARSVDMSQPPKKIFEQVTRQLNEYFKIRDVIRLDPMAKDHVCISVTKL